jgi:hypothetical protein
METILCDGCGNLKPAEDFSHEKKSANGRRQTCRLCVSRKNLAWRRAGKPKIDKPRLYAQEIKERCKQRRIALRTQTLEAYGGRCACCGEATPEFLTVDHINGGGAEHRRQIKQPLDRWLKKNGFPKENFQLLCFNCNCAKYYFGGCPHQRAPK